jgi:Family of unknown function (DUF5641)
MGGLWEAGIKSAKYHIRRIAGKVSLTYELFNTLLIQIEAVLNSRPLSPMSSDLRDPLPLTPSHFLVGHNMTTCIDLDVRELPESRLDNYERVQQMKQHFWTRWSKEYISELQERKRWKVNAPNLKINSIVLIKENNMPPLCWLLGVVEAVYPGKDGVCRVADVRTSKGILKRSVMALCPLPME